MAREPQVSQRAPRCSPTMGLCDMIHDLSSLLPQPLGGMGCGPLLWVGVTKYHHFKGPGECPPSSPQIRLGPPGPGWGWGDGGTPRGHNGHTTAWERMDSPCLEMPQRQELGEGFGVLVRCGEWGSSVSSKVACLCSCRPRSPAQAGWHPVQIEDVMDGEPAMKETGGLWSERWRKVLSHWALEGVFAHTPLSPLLRGEALALHQVHTLFTLVKQRF